MYSVIFVPESYGSGMVERSQSPRIVVRLRSDNDRLFPNLNFEDCIPIFPFRVPAQHVGAQTETISLAIQLPNLSLRECNLKTQICYIIVAMPTNVPWDAMLVLYYVNEVLDITHDQQAVLKKVLFLCLRNITLWCIEQTQEMSALVLL